MNIKDIRRYQKEMRQLKATGFNLEDFKEILKRLQKEFDLSFHEAKSILHQQHKEILMLLERKEYGTEIQLSTDDTNRDTKIPGD